MVLHEFPHYEDGRKSSNSFRGSPLTPRSPSCLVDARRGSPAFSGFGADWSCDMEVRFIDSYADNDDYDRRRPSTTGSISTLTPEGRLSRSLKRWMPDYVLRSLPPQAHPPRQPVFSARLADRFRIRRSDSTESIHTQISLLSCSTFTSESKASPKQKRRRKKKPPEQTNDSDNKEKTSIWMQLAMRSRGELDKMLKKHAIYAYMDTESEIFRHLPPEEQEMVTEAGRSRGLRLGPGRKRSDSASNTDKKLPQIKKPQRTQSAGGTHDGPMLNFMELRRQMVNQRLASQHRSRFSGRRSLNRTSSRVSLLSNASSDVFATLTPREMSPLQLIDVAKNSQQQQQQQQQQVSVWKGDSQILAIDLKRELTAKVKSKIATTTTALERVTGVGNTNESRFFVGTLEEYPFLIEEDFSHIAKVPQRVRISPHLSHVIRTDIHVRMGRPRYHEIKIEDLKLWNRGQVLDRSHRNLKVFNWLHSLRESDFDLSLPVDIEDIPPGGDVTTRDETIVAVDEPKIKPLLERLKTEYIV